jgi:hypothetical protein
VYLPLIRKWLQLRGQTWTHPKPENSVDAWPGSSRWGQIAEAYAALDPTLNSRTPFRLLDLIGQSIGACPLEVANAFAERVAADQTEGGWVIIASILREQLMCDMAGTFERSRVFTIAADIWYATDIPGERVPGPARLIDFDRALTLLAPWRTDPDRWVRRTAGVAAHFWARRAHGEARYSDQVEQLLTFLDPMFEERDIDAIKGVGWGLKTLGRYYPEPVTDWLVRQAGRSPRALMLRKALTFLSPAQRARVTGGKVRWSWRSRKLEQANSYRIWAYRKAAWTIDELSESVNDIYHSHGAAGLCELPGIGNGIKWTNLDQPDASRWRSVGRLHARWRSSRTRGRSICRRSWKDEDNEKQD